MATDQIRQMVNFILQEAHEKANEIRVKVCVFVFQIIKIISYVQNDNRCGGGRYNH